MILFWMDSSRQSSQMVIIVDVDELPEVKEETPQVGEEVQSLVAYVVNWTQ